eukprot:Transcript_20270.p1 GENE.Transcript_20270~~Transcript_20270.p1  ORF type:complete len:360 (-),score=46.76 Transcript_20270:394-1317(-)
MAAAKSDAAVVLVHGMAGWASQATRRLGFEYFHGVRSYLQSQHGITRVLTPGLSPLAPSSTRAAQLRDAIHKWNERRHGERVTIIAHSQGGLDARYAISRLQADGLAWQLITMGTPHRGTALCDRLVWPAARRLPTALADALDRAGLPVQMAQHLTRDHMLEEFNPTVIDAPDVRYLSLAGARSPLQYWAPLIPTAALLSRWEGPNDGLVSGETQAVESPPESQPAQLVWPSLAVESAQWGEFLGCEDLDHVEMINFPFKVGGAAPWRMWERLAQLTHEQPATSQHTSSLPRPEDHMASRRYYADSL